MRFPLLAKVGAIGLVGPMQVSMKTNARTGRFALVANHPGFGRLQPGARGQVGGRIRCDQPAVLRIDAARDVQRSAT